MARTSRRHGADGLRSSRRAFLAAFVLLVGITDLGGAARFRLSHAGRRRSEQEVREASGGRGSLAGVVDPETLSGAAETDEPKDAAEKYGNKELIHWSISKTETNPDFVPRPVSASPSNQHHPPRTDTEASINISFIRPRDSAPKHRREYITVIKKNQNVVMKNNLQKHAAAAHSSYTVTDFKKLRKIKLQRLEFRTRWGRMGPMT